MRKISAFNFLTINGFYKGVHEDTSWHVHGEEGSTYSEKKLESDHILLFGRKTYDMMFGFWPSQMAAQAYPKVALKINAADKLVISNSMKKADWTNTKILSGEIIELVKALKSSPGKNISILGSGSIIHQLTEAGLIDEYEFMIDPLAIGKGTVVFEGITSNLELEFVSSSVFKKSGQVVLTYKRK